MTVVRGYAYLGYSIGMSVFSLGQPAPPPLSVNLSETTVTCSWPVPNPAFAVQQNPDLNPTHWITLTNTPKVVGSENQVTLPRPAQGIMFYRLASQ